MAAAAVNSIAASPHQRFRHPHHHHVSTSTKPPSQLLLPIPFWFSTSPSTPTTSRSITPAPTPRANRFRAASSSSAATSSSDVEVDRPSSAADAVVRGFGFETEGNGNGNGEVSTVAAAATGFSSSSASTSTTQLEVGSGGGGGGQGGGEDFPNMADRAINAAIVLAAGTFAITKLLTIDRDYWHGWTIYEILRYAPLHNWSAYEEALKTNPVLAKMMISGVVYSVGDWIAQCYEGKPLFDFDRARMFRSGLVGFTLHGSLSHYYYYFCEALFPFQDWWVVPAKVLFDQTVWAAIWNSIYYVVLGFLRFESPVAIFGELKATFWPMLTAGWKLWPFAHVITYGVIPVEQRLLWVDCVELVWVTILSTYSNEKSEARHAEALPDSETNSLEE